MRDIAPRTLAVVALLCVGAMHAVYVLAQRRPAVDVELVWCSGLVTALTTGLGVLPFVFTSTFDQRYVAYANAMGESSRARRARGACVVCALTTAHSGGYDVERVHGACRGRRERR